MAAEDEEFDERAFDNDDDRDEVSDEGDVTAIEKSADPFIRFRRIGHRIGRKIRRRVLPVRRRISSYNTSWSSYISSFPRLTRPTKTISVKVNRNEKWDLQLIHSLISTTYITCLPEGGSSHKK